MVKRKILIIDDDPFWRKLLRRLFDGSCYDVQVAGSCADGVRLAEERKPDCILLDFHLGDGDAVLVCAALKKDDGRPGFPVVVVSSDPAAEIAAYEKCRADYFVFKGSQAVVELPSIVEKIVERTTQKGLAGRRPAADH